jgi:hypothetical protein
VAPTFLSAGARDFPIPCSSLTSAARGSGARPSPAAATCELRGHVACLRRGDGAAVRCGGLNWAEVWHGNISQRPRTGADRARGRPRQLRRARGRFNRGRTNRAGVASGTATPDKEWIWHDLVRFIGVLKRES